MRRSATLLALVAMTAAVVTAVSASAATTSIACGDVVALEAAVLTAGGNGEPDEVVLAPDCTYDLPATLVLLADGGRPTVLRGGPGTVLDGGGAVRLVEVREGADVTLTGFSLTGGAPVFEINQTRGAAVRNFGTVRLVEMTVRDSGGGRVGGGLDNSGTATVDRTLFTGNDATTQGAAIYNVGSLVVRNSTLTASTRGDALFAETSAKLLGSTVAGNEGPGIVALAEVLLGSSVVADNAVGCAAAAAARFLDAGGNVDADGSCGLQSGSRSSVDADLVPTPAGLLAPGPGSAALDAGEPGTCAADLSAGGIGGVDQRGVRRPQGRRCDAGAVESAARLTGPASATLPGGPPGTDVADDLVLTAQGPDPSLLGRVEVAPPFRVLADDCSGATLDPGATCRVRVGATLSPDAQSGALRVLDNGGPDPVVVALSAPPAAAEERASAPVDDLPSREGSAAAEDTTGRESADGGTDDAAATGPAAGPTAPVGAAPDTTPPAATPPAASPPAASTPTVSPPTVSTPTDVTPTDATSTDATPAAPDRAAPGSAGPATAAAAPPVVDGPLRRETARLASQRSDLPERPSISATLPRFGDVDLSLRTVGQNALWALALILLLMLPVTIVNQTLEKHAGEVHALLRRVVPVRLRRRPLTSAPTVLVVALIGGTAYALLDPALGLDRRSAALVLGLALAILTLASTVNGAAAVHLLRSSGTRSSYVLQPGFVALALCCVAVSRVSGLQPGLVLGMLATLQLTRSVSQDQLGRAVGAAYGSLLLLAGVCYAVWHPVSTAASLPSASFGTQVADVALATVFLAGTQAVAFGMLPLSFVDGSFVRVWSARAWAALFFFGWFALVQLVLHPTRDVSAWAGREDYLLGVLGCYLLGALAFWAAFRRRTPTPAEPAPTSSAGHDTDVPVPTG